MTIRQHSKNVRIISTGCTLDDSDTVQYFNGTEWVDYLTVYQYEDNMISKRNATADMLARKYPDTEPVYVRYVAQVRPTAPIKNEGQTHYFDTREEAVAFIQSDRNFFFFEVRA